MCLKHRLNHVMVIARRQHLDVQIHPCRVGDRIEELLHHLRVHVSDSLYGKITVEGQIRPSGEIYRA